MDIIESYLQQLNEDNAILVAGRAFVKAWKILLGFEKDPEQEYITNKCKQYQKEENKKCRKKVIVAMRKKFLSQIPSHKANCSKQKNPDKCVAYLNKKEEKLKQQIANMEEDIRKM